MDKNQQERSKYNLTLCCKFGIAKLSEEDTTKKLWDKLGNLYQSKSIVNKFLILKKLYLLSMNDDDSVIEHLNAFNTIIS